MARPFNKEKIGDSIEKKVGATADAMHHLLLTLTNAAGDVTWKIVD
jgi:hypothetical protein